MLVDMKEIALDILSYSWPIIVITSIIAVTLRLSYLIFHHEKLVLYRELFYLFFIIYVMCLYQVVTYQDVTWSGANYIPFKEILRYNLTDPLFYKNVFGNILLFLPLGFFIKKQVGAKRLWQVLLISIIVSVSIELTQLIIGRVFDVDDIILNIVGAGLGYFFGIIYAKLKDKMPGVLKKDFVLNILAIILTGGLICFLIP